MQNEFSVFSLEFSVFLYEIILIKAKQLKTENSKLKTHFGLPRSTRIGSDSYYAGSGRAV